MINRVYNIYNSEIQKVKNDDSTRCIFLVGSSKDLDLEIEGININDIDIFILSDQKQDQIRVIKDIQGVEFDINYFSIQGMNKFIECREYFFLKEMKDAKVLYDKNKEANSIVKLCKQRYEEGPNKISYEEKLNISNNIYSKISRLKDKSKFTKFEYEFLTNLYLKDIIIAYFNVHDKWVPKDKKLLRNLENEDKNLLELLKVINKDYNYKDLIIVCDYIFKNITY